MERSLEELKTYRYQILHDNPGAKKVLYVLHGYGQLVKYFIRKFSDLPEDLLIVAPEGMHRYYTQGTYGRVGASWMTKELRETDIKDNIRWLNTLDKTISQDYPIQERYLLGFSQGGSTAIRWKIHGRPKFDGLIIWASDFPPEEKENSQILSDCPSYFCIGSEDEFYNEAGQNELTEYYKNIGFKISNYLGPHDIDKEALKRILKELQIY